MTDIKSMFAKMSSDGNDSGSADDTKRDLPPPPKPTNKKQTIEKTYQKKTQLEHILLRPDTYIGSIQHVKEEMWIYDFESEMMVQKEIEYVPGLYKIFDEILVNAADNKQQDKTMNCIKVDINADTNTISVWNNGQGIPVTLHKDEKMYVPTMIFGHLLTSSNYNDEEEKVTGGRNGYGAKLCNIYSTKFTVETGNKEYKRQFKQTWGANMTKASEPKIKDFTGSDFTKVTFSPDLAKFKMDKLDDDIIALMSRRAFDVAASTRGVAVYLNGKRCPVKTFKDYINLYIKDKKDSTGGPLKVAYENVNERWEVAVTVSNNGFQQVSFVNSIATTSGGRHVDHVADMIAKQLVQLVKKKNKGGIDIKQGQVKMHMWVFINCLIVNPTYDTQTKVKMTLPVKSFGSKCNLSEKFISAVSKGGIVEAILSWAKEKAQDQLSKTSGKKTNKIKGIPKLEDANEAGKKFAASCTLILTEGDSAKTLVLSGLGVLGRDLFGVFPLRGKLLNVREASHKQIHDNAEIQSIVKIVGLDYKLKYNSEQDMKKLRYGKMMIMTDQDMDGSHIKGLLINFIHHNWPELLRRNFLEEFITPIVKATKRNEVLSFYSLPELDLWKENTPNHHTYSIKYYKGLGTSDANEAKEYFSDMARHRIPFRYTGQQDDDHIVLAFSKKHVDSRKEWLTNFMVESKRRKEIGLPEKYLYTKDTKSVSYTDFINLELVQFSNADNVRSIPSMVDGLKPGQRKVLFTCFKRNDKRDIKVAQLSGSVAEHTAYHHGEASLCATIVNLAQNFVGSNNLNLLEPIGQFGSRLSGGKDSASARYIYTKLSPLARMVIHPNDDALLKHEYEDNQKIEPEWYMPIIPMVLVNGADGIGTGWMTKIPNYNPREIVQNIRNMIDGEDPVPMLPWYKGFKGTIEDCGDHRYLVSGEIAVIGPDKIEITELPVGTWTQTYKENVLEPLFCGSEKVKAIIADYREYHTDVTVKFVITLLPGQMANIEKEGFHKVFKLQTIINTSSMCAFDEMGCLRRYESVMDILKEFYALRLKLYQTRKDYMMGILEAEALKLTHQARFIMEKCSHELVVENKKRKAIVDELIRRNYPADPVKEWKIRNAAGEEAEEHAEEESQEEEEVSTSKKPGGSEKNFKELSDVKKYDYLLGMSMWMLTEERKNELLRQRDTKLAELDTLKRKTPATLWREDLDTFCDKLNTYEEAQKKKAEDSLKKTDKIRKKTAGGGGGGGSGGKNKMALAETMPSPMAQRVVPTVTEDMKKKIQQAVKLKENKGKKGTKKENIAVVDDGQDEFDMMVQDKKSLKDKLGTPEQVEKKTKNKKAKDGLKQSKLNFKSKSDDDKVNGSPKKTGKKKKLDFSDEEEENISGSDSEVEFSSQPTVKERTMSRRAATKTTKYVVDSSGDEKLSSGDEELFENDGIKEESLRQDRYRSSSDSEAEVSPVKQETSENLFDSLVGKSREESSPPQSASPLPPPTKRKIQKRIMSDSEVLFDSSDSDSMTLSRPKKKKTKIDSDDEDYDLDSKETKQQPKKKKTAGKSKMMSSSSEDNYSDLGGDSDSDFEVKKPKPKKKAASKSKKKLSSDDDGDQSDFGVRKKTAKTSKKK